MNSRLVCLSCGFQLVSVGPRTRCPVCGTLTARQPSTLSRLRSSRVARLLPRLAGLVIAFFLTISVLHIAVPIVLVASVIVLGLFGEFQSWLSRGSNAPTDTGLAHQPAYDARGEFFTAGGDGLGGEGGGPGGGE